MSLPTSPHAPALRLAAAFLGLVAAGQLQSATVAYYQFTGTDGASASSVADSSGNGLTATGSASGAGAVLPSYAADTPGSVILDGLGGNVLNSNNTTSVKFDNAGANDASPVFNTGRGGRITVTNSAFEASSFTFEAFVKVESNIQFASIAGKERNSGSTWLLDTNSVGATGTGEPANSQLRLRIDHQEAASGGSTPGFNQNITSANPGGFFSDDAWHHIAFTFNNDTNTFTFFKDYVAVGSGTINSSGVQDLVYTGGPFFLGNAGGGRAFDGWMDEVRFSDSLLTTDQFLRAVPEPGRGMLWMLGMIAFSLRRHRPRISGGNSR